MKGVTIVLILYSVSMVFYGSVEITHDILHELSDLHVAAFHDHSHDHHHSFHDHHHTADHDHVMHHHAHSDTSDEQLPSMISLFLFIEKNSVFNFANSLLGECLTLRSKQLSTRRNLPFTPPPELLMLS